MNRELKFRAWDDTLFKMMPSLTLEEIAKADMSGVNWYQLTLIQFIGLCDKNGKEIYEGDIVLLDKYFETYYSEASENAIAEIIYYGSCWCYKIGNKYEPIFSFIEFDTKDEFCKVIGNIFENKDLLN